MSKKFSLRDVLSLLPQHFSIYVRRAFGGCTYFEGYVEDVPNDVEYLNLQVYQISGGSIEKYVGQTLKLSKDNPIDYLDIALTDLRIDNNQLDDVCNLYYQKVNNSIDGIPNITKGVAETLKAENKKICFEIKHRL